MSVVCASWQMDTTGGYSAKFAADGCTKDWAHEISVSPVTVRDGNKGVAQKRCH